jgi:undecaprenyl diphosphate synthase
MKLPEASLSQTTTTNFHVAIIMDGNGRWAQQRGLPRRMGHFYGAETARKIVKAACQNGISHMTLFGFSSENWNRPKPEIDYLMGLLRSYLRKDMEKLHANGIRLAVIGDRAALPADIVELIEQAEQLTGQNARLHLTIALNYGGRSDIVAAARRVAALAAAGELEAGELSESGFSLHLPSAFLPDADLLIRTSGEQRLSNFLLWQMAYAEMLFVERYWPDFTVEDLNAALTEFRQRNRRFGGIGR